jgi:hypothetical protein
LTETGGHVSFLPTISTESWEERHESPKFQMEPLEGRLLLSADVLEIPTPTLQENKSEPATISITDTSPDAPLEIDLDDVDSQSIQKLVDEGVNRLENLNFSAE